MREQRKRGVRGNRIHDGMHRSLDLWRSSQYWSQRAEKAIRCASYKERPDVRARRIKKLEAQQRQVQRQLEHSLRLLEQDQGERAPAEIDAHKASIARAERWIAHLGNRLTYESAMLVADGGIEADRNKPEKGGACQCWASPRG